MGLFGGFLDLRTPFSRNELTTSVREESFPSMDVNHLYFVHQFASKPGVIGEGDGPAFRPICQAFGDYLLNKRGLSAWCDHLRLRASANG